MTAHEYLLHALEDLGRTPDIDMPADNDQLAEAIFKLLMSKKFRKYSASPELQEHMRSAIRLNIANNEPINLTFLHGAYKLWRLDEAPEVDWAELFSHMYYTAWLKPVCAIYPPGVWFDLFVDDLIVPKLNNVGLETVEQYLASYQELLDFLRQYQPDNLRVTITTVSSQFDSPEAFETSLAGSITRYDTQNPEPLNLSDQDKATVELNTKVTDEQLRDPLWQEKVQRLHNAYMSTKAEPGYHNQPTKIKVFTQPLPAGMTISVGTTKDSVAKFWVGVGALKPSGDNFRRLILSPSQLSTARFDWQDVSIPGLDGRNFHKIRILK